MLIRHDWLALHAFRQAFRAHIINILIKRQGLARALFLQKASLAKLPMTRTGLLKMGTDLPKHGYFSAGDVPRLRMSCTLRWEIYAGCAALPGFPLTLTAISSNSCSDRSSDRPGPQWGDVTSYFWHEPQRFGVTLQRWANFDGIAQMSSQRKIFADHFKLSFSAMAARSRALILNCENHRCRNRQSYPKMKLISLSLAYTQVSKAKQNLCIKVKA